MQNNCSVIIVYIFLTHKREENFNFISTLKKKEECISQAISIKTKAVQVTCGKS